MKKIIGILFAILVIALLAVGGVILYKWAIKGESPSFEYTVKVEEIEYKDGATIELKLGENIIELKRPFYESGEISVEIRRNKDKDFDFKAGDKILGYAGIDDLTAAFDVEQLSSGKIALHIPKGFSMEDILQKLYPDEVISGVPTSIDLSEESYFFLQVNFGRKTMKFDLILEALPTEIVLDPPNIVF